MNEMSDSCRDLPAASNKRAYRFGDSHTGLNRRSSAVLEARTLDDSVKELFVTVIQKQYEIETE